MKHKIEFSYQYDCTKDCWSGEVRYTEWRNGKQYGGTAVSEVVGEKGDDFRTFIRAVRAKVKRELDTFWT